jgi:hypothetical protein
MESFGASRAAGGGRGDESDVMQQVGVQHDPSAVATQRLVLREHKRVSLSALLHLVMIRLVQ